MANIEMNYFDGENYTVLYPSTIASQVSGVFSSSQIPNLDMSKITTGNLSGSRISGSVSSATTATTATNSTKLNGYTYSQVISNAQSGMSGGFANKGNYIGTNTTGDLTLSASSPYSLILGSDVCFVVAIKGSSMFTSMKWGYSSEAAALSTITWNSSNVVLSAGNSGTMVPIYNWMYTTGTKITYYWGILS